MQFCVEFCTVTIHYVYYGMELYQAIIGLAITHYVADFLLQSREMGEGKSSSLYWLSLHVMTYSTVFGVLGFMFFTPIQALSFFCITFVAHFCTDFVSSKLSAYCHRTNRMGAFWNVIGADQLLHFVQLILTYVWCVA